MDKRYMLNKELLDMLCCPKCRGELLYNEKNNTLTCTSCGKTYEVQDDIPILLPKDDGK